jgi:hypothetical protein
MMATQTNAARLHKEINAQQDRQLRQQALQDPQVFVSLAERQGYRLNANNLAEEVAKLSAPTIAAIWNPGIGDRRHLLRR